MKEKRILKLPIFCLIYLGVIVLSIVLDQLTKLWIFDNLLGGKVGNKIPLLGDSVTLTAVLNKGAAFGAGQGDSANVVFFIVTVIGVPLFVLLLLRSRTKSVLSQIAYALIIGGTIGNAIDRGTYATDGTFFSGMVRDFISCDFINFPVFNVADICLTGGVFMAVASLIYFDPDSLVKTMILEQQQKAMANETTQTPTQTDDVVDMQSDLPNENDTTNN